MITDLETRLSDWCVIVSITFKLVCSNKVITHLHRKSLYEVPYINPEQLETEETSKATIVIYFILDCCVIGYCLLSDFYSSVSSNSSFNT